MKQILKLAFIHSQLASIKVNATTPPKIEDYVFSVSTDLKIYVPAESVEAYKNAEGWRRYAQFIVAQ